MSLAVDERPARFPRGFGAFWYHPRKSWIRRALFQVHLWSGISVGIFATLVGISGSAIVYKDSLDKILTPGLFCTSSGSKRLTTDQLLEKAHAAHPGWSI